LEGCEAAASGEVAAEPAVVEAQRVDLGEEEQMSDHLKVPAGEPVPLSHLELDLPAPTIGWAAGLAERGISVQVDDVGRLSVSRRMRGDFSPNGLRWRFRNGKWWNETIGPRLRLIGSGVRSFPVVCLGIRCLMVSCLCRL
jgi:hypothetical protein